MEVTMFLRSSLLSSTRPFYAPDDEGAIGTAENDVTVDDGASTEEGAEGTETQEAKTEEQKTDWRDKQIDRQHRTIQETKREAERLRQENEDLKALAAKRLEGNTDDTQTTTTPVKKELSEADVNARAERIANEKLAEQSYNADCNRTYEEGKKAYGDKFDAAVKRLPALGGIDQDTMISILATDNPHKVLYELGSKPEEFQRIMDLSPAKRQNEFVKIAITNEQKTTSNAPEPVETLGGRGQSRTTSTNIYDEKLSDDDFYALRAKQKAARHAQKTGRA
jgi:hypothetical protein